MDQRPQEQPSLHRRRTSIRSVFAAGLLPALLAAGCASTTVIRRVPANNGAAEWETVPEKAAAGSSLPGGPCDSSADCVCGRACERGMCSGECPATPEAVSLAAFLPRATRIWYRTDPTGEVVDEEVKGLQLESGALRFAGDGFELKSKQHPAYVPGGARIVPLDAADRIRVGPHRGKGALQGLKFGAIGGVLLGGALGLGAASLGATLPSPEGLGKENRVNSGSYVFAGAAVGGLVGMALGSLIGLAIGHTDYVVFERTPTR